MQDGRILVTGATGFLGGRLVDVLRAAGRDVVAWGRRPSAVAKLEAKGFKAAAIDLADARALADTASDGIDCIVHCAARSSPWGAAGDFDADNIHATANLRAFARRNGIPGLIFISSPSVTFRFADQIGIRETQPLPPPVNHYARSKAAAEALVAGAQDLATVTLRPRGIYGAGDTALLPRLIAAAQRGPLPLFRGGQAVIDVTHVDDVCSAILAAIAALPSGEHRTYHVSGGEALAVTELAERSAARAGVSVRWRALPWWPAFAAIRAQEQVHRLLMPTREPRVTAYAAGLFAFSQTLDISAIARDLDWRPSIDFASGLDRTFERGRHAAD